MTHFFVIVTTDCNLKCRYCCGKECESDKILDNFNIDYSIPLNISYDIKELKSFIEKDKNPTIILYGGEPLLQISKIKEIMDNLNARYMLQTNGLFLKELGENYIKRLYNIMFSIDGNKKITDYYRGKGVYNKIIENVKWLKEIGFKKEILARMTVSYKTDIYKQVLHLLSIFDSVHWQIDAQFFEDYDKDKFSRFKKEYNNQIKKLIDYWLNYMKKNNKVLKIYPFVGITQSLLKNEKSFLRCGAGHSQYAVLTDGNISACPVMGGIKDFYIGHIKDSSPNSLNKVLVTQPCSDCDILDLCGGRCLYANKTKLWGEDGFNEVCDTIRFLISSLKEKLPEIKELINKDKIKLSGFDYDRFNSCEIIP